MDLRKLLDEIDSQPVSRLDGDDLAVFLDSGEEIRAENTRMAGWIRILDIEGRIMVQEQNQDGDLLVRVVESLQAAERFVQERMETYDRMWDGCGCKIDYFGDLNDE